MTRSDTPFPPSTADVEALCHRSYEIVCALESLERSLRDMAMDLCTEHDSVRVSAYLELSWRMVAHLRISEAEPLDVGLNQMKRAASDHSLTAKENVSC